MKQLSQEYLQYLFTYDGYNLIWRVSRSNRIKIGDAFGSDTGNGYYKGSIDKAYYKVHRLVWIYHNGDIPENMQIDHINGDGQDNRIENLRVATDQENKRNRVKQQSFSSIFKGVNYDIARGKWKAEMRVDNRSVFLGRFDTEQEAYDTYCNAAKKLYGEFFNNGYKNEEK